MTVVRDGQRQEVGSTELLVGDVMLLSTGDILPADGMLFEGNDIRHAQPVYPAALYGREPASVARHAFRRGIP